MKSRRRVALGLALVVVLAVGGWAAWNARPQAGRQVPSAGLVAEAAPVDSAGFARATGPRPLSFPADFGPHDDYQTEWWYYTGNLDTADGRHFGFQLTFFRRALEPPDQAPGAVAQRRSAFATNQVYMGHLALTDVAGGQHYAYQRLERGAAGLAGAQGSPYRVWLDNWAVTEQPGGDARLRAAEGPVALDLTLHNQKGPVLQGDQGYSRKGPEPGNASYYYSLTRIASQGTITVNGQAFKVTGLSWMDHEYSTSALSAGQIGWDWFSIQLNDGRELMLFELRRADGSVDAFSSGTLIAADGKVTRLGPKDFKLTPGRKWHSPHSGADYPVAWQISIPSAGLQLETTPYIDDQEMNLGSTYWEGASRISGSVSGMGYVEMTGYAGSIAGQF